MGREHSEAGGVREQRQDPETGGENGASPDRQDSEWSPWSGSPRAAYFFVSEKDSGSSHHG